jgi:hypothetical protein
MEDKKKPIMIGKGETLEIDVPVLNIEMKISQVADNDEKPCDN